MNRLERARLIALACNRENPRWVAAARALLVIRTRNAALAWGRIS
jgi:hypothetical protein